MSTKFDFFEGTRTANQSPQITVRKSGQLVLTTGAIELFGEEVSHVQFGYDPDARAVGIRPAPEDAKGRYTVRQQDNGTSIVNGKRFFAHHGLTPEKATTFEAELLADGIVGYRLPADDTEKADPDTKARSKKSKAA